MNHRTRVRLPRLLAVALVACVGLSGCDENDTALLDEQAGAAQDEAPRGTEPATVDAPGPLPGSMEGPAPVEVRSDALALGTELSPDGAALAPREPYAASDTVYVAMPTTGYAAGDVVRVYWTNTSTGVADKQESKTVTAGQPYVSFAFSQADGLAPGPYSVQVDVNEVPVGILDFNVE